MKTNISRDQDLLSDTLESVLGIDEQEVTAKAAATAVFIALSELTKVEINVAGHVLMVTCRPGKDNVESADSDAESQESGESESDSEAEELNSESDSESD
jgi:hypothetical protein